MGHRSGWWRIWNGMGWMSCGSRSRGARAISSCINNLSLHLKIKQEVRKSILIFLFLEMSQGDGGLSCSGRLNGPSFAAGTHSALWN